MSPLVSAPLRLAARPARRRAAISLTPLIDVVFILLVFFMLASSFIDWRSITLATPAPAGASASMDGAMLVELRADGTLRLSGEVMTPEQLAGRLRQRLAEAPDQRVLVRAGRGVALQPAVALLDRLGTLGVRDLSLIGDVAR
jgi:biopolymer transport protein ExbD